MNARTRGFDPSAYAQAPIITIGTGLTLVASLIAVIEAEDSHEVRTAAHKLRAIGVEAHEGWVAHVRARKPVSPPSSRDIDNVADVAWGALRSRLLAYGNLPADTYPLAARAIELDAILFPEGLGFLGAAYREQYAQMDVTLTLIATEKLDADLDRVAGPEFLAHVREVHGPYGAMVKSLDASGSDHGSDVSLLPHVRALGSAIRSYALRVVAEVDESEPTTLARAKHLLAPIDAHRAARGRNDKSSSTSAPSPEPPPPVPGAPPVKAP